MLERDLEDARRAREGERESADMLAEAQRRLAEATAAKAQKEEKVSSAPARTNLVQQFAGGGLEGSNDSRVVGMRAAVSRAQRNIARRQARSAAVSFYDSVKGAAAGHIRGRFDSTALAERQLMEQGEPTPAPARRANAFDDIEAKFGRPRGQPSASPFDEIDQRFGRPRDVMNQGAGSGSMGKAVENAKQSAQGGQGDIYKLLNDVLNKLTSAPMVSV